MRFDLCYRGRGSRVEGRDAMGSVLFSGASTEPGLLFDESSIFGL